MASVGKMYLSITLGYILFGFSSWTAAAEFPWNDTADPNWPFQNVTVTDICKNDTKLYFEELNKKWKWPRQVHFAEWSFQSNITLFYFWQLHNLKENNITKSSPLSQCWIQLGKLEMDFLMRI